jgi:hypothetical protein
MVASLADRLRALLGVSAYEAPPPGMPSIDDAEIERVRMSMGGQLIPLPQTRTRWYLADLENAVRIADAGDIAVASQLCRSLRRDGVLAGLLSTSAGGLVRLPKRFTGGQEMVRALEGRDGVRSVFDMMVPPGELEAFAGDIQLLNVAVGELVPVPDRGYPIFRRHDPEFLSYRWNEDRWYFRSVAGLLPITPGDGRWVLHTGGRMAPWQHGLWAALARAWINKEHALLHRSNWEAKLANPARVAVAPQGATEGQRLGFLSQIIAWGVNSVFDLPPGYDIRLIESNGRGYESFGETIEWAEREYMIAISGQVVTTTGGTGFANADVHKSIRADLIKARADALAYTVNTQIIPQWAYDHFGEEALDQAPALEWDTTPPRDLKIDADALASLGNALTALLPQLPALGVTLDGPELVRRFALPIAGEPDPDAGAGEELVPDLGEDDAQVPEVLQ